jgi:hypothetical protein
MKRRHALVALLNVLKIVGHDGGKRGFAAQKSGKAVAVCSAKVFRKKWWTDRGVNGMF